VSDTSLAFALSAIRIISYVGFVLVAGTLTFLVAVWPQGRRDRLLVQLIVAGAGLLAVATVAGPLVEAYAYDVGVAAAVGRLSGAAALVRLAVLVVVVSYLPDLMAHDIRGWRRSGLALLAVFLIAATLVAQSNAIGGDWELVKIVATLGHLTATAAWLGGLVALATVLIPREHLADLHQILPRFSRIAMASIITLVGTGAIHALVVAGGIGPLLTSRYGGVLGLKIAVFALMLLLGDRGRRYASRLAQRRLDQLDGTAAPAGMHALAVALGAELTLALVVLGATAALVWFAP
jgi:putative copper export protein